MEWNEKLQVIIDYVEEHLQRKEEPINERIVSEMAGCSYGFFQKVFSYMNEISFSEYVRARKLTLAGYDLKSTSMKVVDISYKYGYDSPTSFTKAFQQFHGFTPKAARNQDMQLKVVPKMQLLNKQNYTWKLESKSSLRLVGKSKVISCVNNSQYTLIPEFWSECQHDGDMMKLISLDTGNPQGMLGVFSFRDDIPDEMIYSIMVISDKEVPDGYTEMILPDVTWAIFDCQGKMPEAIQNGWKYLHEEWIVKYPFQHAPCPEIEWYSNANQFSDTYQSQIWIPILEEK